MAEKTVKVLEVKRIPLADVKSNMPQSRGMGVLSSLQSEGWQVFEKGEGGNKPPLWSLLFSDSEAERKQSCELIEQNEPELVELAKDLETNGQLQAAGVRKVGTGWDVIFGMKRTLALAYNFAKTGKGDGCVEAKIYTEKISAVDLKLLAISENSNREDESPIDRAITYKWLKDNGTTVELIATRITKSVQHVRDYINLLDKRIADVLPKVHARTFSVDKALNILRKRKGTGGKPEQNGSSAEHRLRLPGSKELLRIYNNGKKPEEMEEREWDLWKSNDVRRLLAFRLGLEYTEFVAKEDAAPEPEASSDTPAAPVEETSTEPVKETPKPKKFLKIKRARANALMLACGLSEANVAKWKDDFVAQKLENIVAWVESDKKLENASLQKLLDSLLKAYTEGVGVKVEAATAAAEPATA